MLLTRQRDYSAGALHDLFEAEGVTLSLPHIRLDRALQFLIGDRLA